MAPKPIIRPGPTAAGPPGWEERQQDRLSSAATHSSNGETTTISHGRSSSNQSNGGEGGIERDQKGVPRVNSNTGQLQEQPAEFQHDPPKEAKVGLGGKLKNKFHKMGEKLAIIPPRDAEAGVSTQVSIHLSFAFLYLAHRSSFLSLPLF